MSLQMPPRRITLEGFLVENATALETLEGFRVAVSASAELQESLAGVEEPFLVFYGEVSPANRRVVFLDGWDVPSTVAWPDTPMTHVSLLEAINNIVIAVPGYLVEQVIKRRNESIAIELAYYGTSSRPNFSVHQEQTLSAWREAPLHCLQELQMRLEARLKKEGYFPTEGS